MHDGKSICIEDSCILGRERTGNELFSSNLKVSREHARVTVENSSWFIEDLNSTNGVYLNGVRMEKGIRTKLLSGQKVSLSLSCEFMVVLDQVDREY
jgi:pSer/pThr/pTyr-binding forkhead associated (FHA) protein